MKKKAVQNKLKFPVGIAPWRINDVINRHRDQCVGLPREEKINYWDRVALREFGLKSWADVIQRAE